MRDEVFGAAVVGGGPAGAASALAAARAGLTVALFEPQAMPSDKPCGEGILPSGLDALHELGLDEFSARGRALSCVRYVLASGRVLAIELPRAGLALERSALEDALWRALEREPRVTAVRARVRTERGGDSFLLADGERTWRARTLIAADGVRGQAAEWLRRPREAPRRLGLRARVLAAGELPSVEVHLGGSSEVYLTPLPGQRINVAVLLNRLPSSPPRSTRELYEEALSEHPRAAARLGPLLTPPEARSLGRPFPREVARAGAFLAGDSAGGVDPVLGCGVAIALRTGLAAGRAAAGVLACGSGEPERAYARFVALETGLRARLARSLVFLSAHPHLQDVVARALTSAPPLARALATGVAG